MPAVTAMSVIQKEWLISELQNTEDTLGQNKLISLQMRNIVGHQAIKFGIMRSQFCFKSQAGIHKWHMNHWRLQSHKGH